MKLLTALAVAVLSVAAFGGQRHHKSSWTVHRSDGTTYTAHRRVSSWNVRSYTDHNGTYHKAHKDHGKVYHGPG